jgi:TolB protein
MAQPSGQLCTVTNGSGSVSTADVTDVVVSCVGAYSVGGTVTGLSGSMVLRNNGADDLSVSANGTFTFSELLIDGAVYSVTVAEQPDGQLCIVSAENGTVSGANVTDIAISCDSRAISNKIVFHSDRDGDFEIYRMRPDGSNLVQLTDNDVDDFWPVVSPDGTRIAFWSGRDGNQEIYVMAVDGSNVTRVTDNGSADRQPAWSPDGQRLAFIRVVGGTTEIYSIGLGGAGLVRLTNNTFDDKEPAWSPDGSSIAFMTTRDGNDEVYVMNASDGGNQVNLTNNPGRDGRPDWSPDGSQILFDRNNASVDATWLGDAEIMCMNSDGSGQVRLTTDAAGYTDAQPRWSGNGTRLAFNSRMDTGGTNPQIYVGQINGCAGGITGLDRVTNTSAKDAAADWAPQ